MKRAVGLAQGQVERGAVKRPAPVEPGDLPLRRDREQVEPVDALAQFAKRVGAREVVDRARRLERLLVDSVVDDVLADAGVPVAVEMDDGREPLEAA